MSLVFLTKSGYEMNIYELLKKFMQQAMAERKMDPASRTTQKHVVKSICLQEPQKMVRKSFAMGQNSLKSCIWKEFERVPELCGSERAIWEWVGLETQNFVYLNKIVYSWFCVFCAPASIEAGTIRFLSVEVAAGKKIL